MKISRNDPCSCGSGRKYKHCCLEKDEASRRAEREASNAALAAEVQASRTVVDRFKASEQASTAAWALVQAGQFAEAEVAALDYIERFPETPVGYDLMSLLCEARGEPKAAAQWCRKVIEFMREHPETFTSKDEVEFQRRIDRLDPT
jgi:TolA-binding protein